MQMLLFRLSLRISCRILSYFLYMYTLYVFFHKLFLSRLRKIMEQKYEEEIQMLQQEIEMLEAEQEETLRAIFIEHGDRLQRELLVWTTFQWMWF